MSSEWIQCCLGDVITLKRGYDLPKQSREQGAVLIVSSPGISDYHKMAMAKAPGVVTGRYGTIGNVYYLAEDYFPLNTTLYVKDFKGDFPRFISYHLRTIDFDSCSGKAAAPGVNRNHLHELETVAPPINEQKAIAHILGALDDKIELNRKTNETLEAMAKALFKSWFVDFDPVRAKAESRSTGLPAGISDLLPDSFEDSELGEIPSGWNAAELGDISTISGGKQLESVEPKSKGRFPVYGANGTMGFHDLATHNSFAIIYGRVGAYCGSINWEYGGAWVANNASSLIPLRYNEFV